ncbi:hypothetical protein [Collimonas sp.]|jgi:hypothetical protein|uniref:hypothetical protein n=1 Tax=Collimonas sp. TaxID=1963772 RepID=UPI002C3B8D15|nr:hypothetical protein [Collimonas sp.]HWW05888.1 hypothetical protein [Collimonas sp.]
MISHACPIIVLDDVRKELLEVAHGLGVCGLPVMSHLVNEGTLERVPSRPYTGIRLLVTDLHLLGPTQTKKEQYIGALISFTKQLVSPSTYLVVFWSNYAEEAAEAWAYLSTRIDPALKPFGYEVLPKDIASAAANGDVEAIKNIQSAIDAIIKKYPQLQAVMEWEASVSRSAAETTNELVRTITQGGATFENQDHVKKVMARMAQEALGYPHAPASPTKGIVQALLPIAQDCLEREASNGYLDAFLEIPNAEKIGLPNNDLVPLLNDFFIHSANSDVSPLDRGAVIRLSEVYLNDKEAGLSRDVGPTDVAGDWRETVCREFAHSWNATTKENQDVIKKALDGKNIYAVELSADCDYAQNKPRAQRFLFALFVSSDAPKPFFSNGKGGANESIYVTPEIHIEKIRGRLLVSCRIFFTKPHGSAPDGKSITRLRKDVIDEISHQYSSHMRRPGKIAFY